MLRSWNSAYKRRFWYAGAIMRSWAKDRNKCCCWRKINIYFGIILKWRQMRHLHFFEIPGLFNYLFYNVGIRFWSFLDFSLCPVNLIKQLIRAIGTLVPLGSFAIFLLNNKSWLSVATIFICSPCRFQPLEQRSWTSDRTKIHAINT